MLTFINGATCACKYTKSSYMYMYMFTNEHVYTSFFSDESFVGSTLKEKLSPLIKTFLNTLLRERHTLFSISFMILRFVSGVSSMLGSATGMRGMLRWELRRRPWDYTRIHRGTYCTHTLYINVLLYLHMQYTYMPKNVNQKSFVHVSSLLLYLTTLPWNPTTLLPISCHLQPCCKHTLYIHMHTCGYTCVHCTTGIFTVDFCIYGICIL